MMLYICIEILQPAGWPWSRTLRENGGFGTSSSRICSLVDLLYKGWITICGVKSGFSVRASQVVELATEAECRIQW